MNFRLTNLFLLFSVCFRICDFRHYYVYDSHKKHLYITYMQLVNN